MVGVTARNCCEALDKLTSVFQEGEKSCIEDALEHRLTVFSYWLDREENRSVRTALDNALNCSDLHSPNDANPRFRFSVTLLAVLACLRRTLEAARLDAPAGGPRTLPADALSVAQRRQVAAAVQLVVALSVLPSLPPGVGTPLDARSEFSADLCSAGPHPADQYQRRDQAVLALHQLLLLSADRQLADAVLAAHLGDLVALLLLISAAPLARPGTAGMTADRRRRLQLQRQRLAPELPQLLRRVPDRRAVYELLLLQRCAAAVVPPRRWLHERVTWWLFHYVSRTGGLARMTEALLQFWGQDRLDHVDPDRIQAVANLLVSPHPAFNNDEYFRHLAAEVLSLLRISRPEVRSSTLRVAGSLSSCLWNCAAGRRWVDQEIVRPLLGVLLGSVPSESGVTLPVTNVTHSSEDDDVALSGCNFTPSEGGIANLDSGATPFQPDVAPVQGSAAPSLQSGVTPSECDVTAGVTGAWQLFAVGLEPDSGCLDSLRPYAAALFQLFSAVHGGVSHLRAPCQELLQRLVRHLGATDTLELVLLGDGLGNGRRFVPGDEGGVRVETVPPEEVDNWLLDDDSAAGAFTALLCGVDAPELMADVFALLLERLHQVMRLQAEAEPVSQTGDSLLVWERNNDNRRLDFRRGLLTLRALAALAESEQAQRVLHDAARLLPVVGALLEALPVDADADMAQGLLHTETACLAMGIMAGLLGGQPSTSAVWKAARRLLPPLDALTTAAGAAARVRDMATDLRQLVLTNGVVSHQPTASDQYSAHRSPARPAQSSGGTGETPCGGAAADTRLDPPPHAQSSGGAGETPCGGAAADTRLDPPPHATDTFQRAMYDLADPLLPVRAHALVALSGLLQRRDPETWRHRRQLLHVFQEKLTDDDSYVYLAAVRAVACLADLCTDEVVAGLCGQYMAQSRDTDTRLKLGEAIVRMVRNLGDMAPRYGGVLLNAFLAVCRDPDHLLRASSLSNLAEVCRLLRFSLTSTVHEVFGCLSALVDTDPAIEVRRAAVMVISQLLDGLGVDALKVLEELLSPLYRLLKLLLRREHDPALLHHVHTALDRLETATLQMLFPQRPLQKRIVVLGAP